MPNKVDYTKPNPKYTTQQKIETLEPVVQDIPKETLKIEAIVHVENNGKVNLRSRPTTSSDVLSVLDHGQRLVITGEMNEFYNVNVIKDGVEYNGFCIKKCIKLD